MLHLRSDKGLELKTSTLCGGHVSMIISNYLAIAPTDSAPQFFQPTAGFGVIFQRFLHLTGERRQALGELETRVTRERRSAKKYCAPHLARDSHCALASCLPQFDWKTRKNYACSADWSFFTPLIQAWAVSSFTCMGKYESKDKYENSTLLN